MWDKELGEKCGETWASRGTTLSCAAAQHAARKLAAELDSLPLTREPIGPSAGSGAPSPSARAAGRAGVLRRVRLQLHHAARHAGGGPESDDAPDVQLRGAGRDPRRAGQGCSGSWWPTTSAAPSTRDSAPSRWKAACTWVWGTRSPRTSPPPAAFPTRSACADLGIVPAKHMPEVDVILIEVPDEVGGYGAKGVGEIGCVATAGAVAGALHSYDGIRRVRLPMDDAPAAAGLIPKSRTRSRSGQGR